MNMIDKICSVCGKDFRVSEGCKQECCSSWCNEKKGNIKLEFGKMARSGAAVRGEARKVSKGVTPILKQEKKLLKIKPKDTCDTSIDTKTILNTQKNIMPQSDSNTLTTRRDTVKEETNTAKTTSKAKENTKEIIIGKTAKNYSRKSKPANAVAILPEVCIPSSEGSGKESLASMSLLDKSANHLFGLMRGLTHDKPDHEIRRVECHVADSAAQLGTVIMGLMKVKCDYLKIKNDHQDNK